MRFLVAISVALLAFAGVAAWVVEAEPDWYLRAPYPLEYEHIVSAHARNYQLDPALHRGGNLRGEPLRSGCAVRGRRGRSDAAPAGHRERHCTAHGWSEVEFLSDLRDPEINVRYGSWYLDHLRNRYDSDTAARARRIPRRSRGTSTGGSRTAVASRSRRPERTSTRSSASGACTRRRTRTSSGPRRSDRASHDSTSVSTSRIGSPLPSCTAIPFATMLTKPAIFLAGTSSRRSPRACSSRTCSMSAGADPRPARGAAGSARDSFAPSGSSRGRRRSSRDPPRRPRARSPPSPSASTVRSTARCRVAQARGRGRPWRK